MKIALCVIATGKYSRFLPELLESAAKFFCAGHDTRFFVFTDKAGSLEQGARSKAAAHCLFSPLQAPCSLLPTVHEPWPGPTLHRYRTLLGAEKQLRGYDFVYYIDVDSRFVRPVGDEICGDLMATIHYGFCESPRSHYTYETRYESCAHIGPTEGRRYYCGGFQGGKAATFLAAMRTMDAAIAHDEHRGVIALWHDESHWNRYLIDHPPTVELSHEYMCPEQWRPQTQRIVIVGKNNQEVRSQELGASSSGSRLLTPNF